MSITPQSVRDSEIYRTISRIEKDIFCLIAQFKHIPKESYENKQALDCIEKLKGLQESWIEFRNEHIKKYYPKGDPNIEDQTYKRYQRYGRDVYGPWREYRDR